MLRSPHENLRHETHKTVTAMFAGRSRKRVFRVMDWPKPKFEIETDRAALTISVGAYVSREPSVIAAAEWSLDTKAAILHANGVTPPVYDETNPKAVHAFYAEWLGPKFNRRFAAAHYHLWLNGQMLPSTANMLRRGGNLWRYYSPDLIARAHTVLPLVREAEADGLHHLIPAIIAWQASPHDIRETVGKGLWKRIAGQSKTRNMNLMQRTGKRKPDDWGAYWIRLMDFPFWSWGYLYEADDVEKLTARIASSKTRNYYELHSLVWDAHRMLGQVNPDWSLARLRQEHDLAAREMNRRDYSSTVFASPWAFEKDGFTAALLTTEREVADEGVEMHHCVASYAGSCGRGSYAVLKITGRERATAGLVHGGGNAGLWHIQQVYGSCNKPVTPECSVFAVEASAHLSIVPFLKQAA